MSTSSPDPGSLAEGYWARDPEQGTLLWEQPVSQSSACVPAPLRGPGGLDLAFL